ncbi:protein ImuB [Kribbella antiqua]|uniref:Protein ImuB n=1 Tax=Kribbella antiqua TaxID=2512217 RepID=A0A4R2J125_9ACTN|nr:DNA polymerase Y family protein [Kribbella antiqua]TCO51624.1 protein ImuB [Kribbella antiqua]
MLTRTMVVWVPDWPVTAAAVAAGHSPDEPIAVLEKGKVFAVSAAARAVGVRRGLRARDAQSRCPELVVLKYDPVVDARAFDPVIGCLEALTPGIQVIRPGMCALKARGPTRFYGTESAAAEKLLDRLETFDVPGSRVGIADGPFAAEQAARSSSARTRILVVPPGESPEFLAPFSIDTLERPALTDLLRRLGLRTLGAFAQLPRTEVLTRFGPDGAFAHRLARGYDDRPVVAREIPPELTRTLDFEPAVDRVDQVAFAVRAVADELIARLTELGVVCTTLRVEVGTESGRIHEREWLHPRWFTPADVVDRVRWQLQGSGTATSELTSAVVRLRLVPDQVDPVGAHVDGLWGGGPDERIHRALSRVQSMLGHGAVASVVVGGGRGPAERQTLVPWGDRPVPARPADQPWPGSIGAALTPSTIFPSPLPAQVFAEDGTQVSVSARGVLSGAPAAFRVGSGSRVDITAWAGPWLADERWWDASAESRQARFQFVTTDTRAWLFTLRQATWHAEATYD